MEPTPRGTGVKALRVYNLCLWWLAQEEVPEPWRRIIRNARPRCDWVSVFSSDAKLTHKSGVWELHGVNDRIYGEICSSKFVLTDLDYQLQATGWVS